MIANVVTILGGAVQSDGEGAVFVRWSEIEAVLDYHDGVLAAREKPDQQTKDIIRQLRALVKG